MDAFLSYNRADIASAKQLDAWLASQGLRSFLDTRELRSGQAWLPALERAITTEAAAMLVLVGPSGLGNTQHYEYQLGLTRQAAEPGFPLIPVLLPGTPEYRFPRGFLGLQTWVSFAEGLEDPAARQRLLAALRREPLDAEAVRGAICPYKGLEAFQEEDSRIFFGREAEAEQLHRTVVAHKVAVVIGRSGSGKSSLARAGLLPLLRRKEAGGWGTVWDRIVLRPGRYPLSALAEALDPPETAPGSVEYGAALRRTAALLRDETPDFMAELLHRRLAGLERRTDRFLILLDQAEEMFARPLELTDAQAIRDWQADSEKLVALLLEAAQRGPASLVLTIRSDYFDPLQHSPLGPLLNQAMVATRGVQDLRAAVVGPAQLVGLRFSPGLEDRILRETGRDEGNLPLLQHALKRSWELREGGVITSTAYDRAGGVEQAINLAAQSAYDALGPEGQAAAKRLFLRLVRPGEGQSHVRVRAPLPEEGAQRVVAEFFGAPERRLLFFGQVDGRNTVEVAHEALIRGWPMLLEWVAENRERLATRDAVLDWIAGSGGELLPAGALLARARALLADAGDVAVDDIAPLIHSSEAEAARAIEERAAQAAREAQLATEKLQTAEQLVRRTRLAAVAAAALGLMVLTSRVYAWRDAAAADAARARAEVGFAAARDAANSLVFELAIGLRNREGMPSTLVQELLDRAGRTLDALLIRTPDDPVTLRLRGVAYLEFASTFGTLGDASRQKEMAEKALAILERLAARYGTDIQRYEDLALAHDRMADALRAQGDFPAALSSARTGMTIRAQLAERYPSHTALQHSLMISQTTIGDLLQAQGNLAEAMLSFSEGKRLATQWAEREPHNINRRFAVTVSLDRIGNTLQLQGDFGGALLAHQEALNIRRQLAELHPDDTNLQRGLSVSHGNIGTALGALDQHPSALEAYQTAMEITSRLVHRDRDNTLWLSDLGLIHQRMGDSLRRSGDLAGALHSYRTSMEINSRLSMRDPSNTTRQRSLTLIQQRIGLTLQAQGSLNEALHAFVSGLGTGERLLERDRENTQWQRDVLLMQRNIGEINLRLGHDDLARTYAEASLELARYRRSRLPEEPESAVDLTDAQDLLARIEAAQR